MENAADIFIALLSPPSSDDGFDERILSLESTLVELPLHHAVMDVASSVAEAMRCFETNPAAPGIILMAGDRLVGVLSRQLFLGHMRHPSSLKLFLRRSLDSLHRSAVIEAEIFSESLSIVQAADQALRRSIDHFYDPIVVQRSDGDCPYMLLDTHQLLLAQSRIHQLTSRLLQELVSTLSHDLRTPVLANRSALSAIMGGAFGPVGNLPKEVLGECCSANDDLIKLVDTLLDISRYETGGSRILNREPIDWAKICDRVITWAQNSSNHKCKLLTRIQPDLPTACGDAIELQRVLQNLVDNAVRVSEPEQPVCIEVLLAQPTHKNQQLKVAVHDQGPGLKKQEAKRLFRRFMQGSGRRGRAGLGLYVCRKIVESHGGNINVESVVGLGTTFWFTIPIQPQAACCPKPE
ncbi:MAG: hypothetical protein F6J87_17685 [Spirulina sp. SIO3F2]|nr:hypothetical protein [Spirulina sp. SIO3F2]